MAFTTEKDGFSLKRLYNKCQEYPDTGYVLIIKDTDNNIFGAYCNTTLQTKGQVFQGSCLSFVFKMQPEMEFFEGQEGGHNFQYCEQEYFFLGTGGQEGSSNCALMLDKELLTGHSYKCASYASEALHNGTGSKFTCSTLELYVLI